MKKLDHLAFALIHGGDATADRRLAQLDDLVREAAHGGRRAIGAIADAFGPVLHEEARAALGPAYAHHAGDVVQDFYLGLLAHRFRFVEIQGAGLPWMKRTVRALALAHVRERSPEGDLAG